jgi:hypothetical protein
MAAEHLMAKVQMHEFFPNSCSIGDGWLSLHRHGEPKAYYWMGDYINRLGLVRVYRQHDYTRLDMVADGRLYQRSWPRYWGDRTISRLAARFLSDAQYGVL